MNKLGLEVSEISTQIVQRDRLAEFICLLAIIASSLDNIATEIRELQRTEIAEVHEPFMVERQVGSSTMPHKRNPELCERICGLAKISRSLVIPALENITTWHERDLTQSSSERFIIPEACIIVDYMLLLMARILSGLDPDEERMRRNMDLTEGRTMSEAVMLAIARKGVDRRIAYELVHQLVAESESMQVPFKEALLRNTRIMGEFSSDEIDTILDPEYYLGTAAKQVELLVERTRTERRHRNLECPPDTS
jgi:adenylosuccinate lyase